MVEVVGVAAGVQNVCRTLKTESRGQIHQKPVPSPKNV